MAVGINISNYFLGEYAPFKFTLPNLFDLCFVSATLSRLTPLYLRLSLDIMGNGMNLNLNSHETFRFASLCIPMLCHCWLIVHSGSSSISKRTVRKEELHFRRDVTDTALRNFTFTLVHNTPIYMVETRTIIIR